MHNIFFDLNGYLFLGLIVVAYSVIRSKEHVERWLQLLLAAVVTMAIKTIGLLFYFSHQTDISLIRLMYTWVRDTRVGEISLIVQNYYRIFFQSHIWELFVFIILFLFILFIKKNDWPKKRYYFTWMTLFIVITTLIISFSRSIWLAWVATFLAMLTYIIWKKLLSVKKLLKLALICIIFIILELGFITGVVNVKLPGGTGGGISASQLIKERATETQEAAIGSRFQLLPVLAKKYIEKPFFGSGFGTTVTYQTLDPRTKEINGGSYTSFAFEWGYLDIGVKIGIVGVACYLFFIWKIALLSRAIIKKNPDQTVRWLTIGLLFSLLALAITHITTPYLNHPLGIYLLIMVAVAFEKVLPTVSLEQKP